MDGYLRASDARADLQKNARTSSRPSDALFLEAVQRGLTANVEWLRQHGLMDLAGRVDDVVAELGDVIDGIRTRDQGARDVS